MRSGVYMYIYIWERRNRLLKRARQRFIEHEEVCAPFSPFTTIVQHEAWRTITVSSLNISLLNLKRRSSCKQARSSSRTTNGRQVYATVATTWVNVSSDWTRHEKTIDERAFVRLVRCVLLVLLSWLVGRQDQRVAGVVLLRSKCARRLSHEGSNGSENSSKSRAGSFSACLELASLSRRVMPAKTVAPSAGFHAASASRCATS